jgi:hypothetical protein
MKSAKQKIKHTADDVGVRRIEKDFTEGYKLHYIPDKMSMYMLRVKMMWF